MVDEDDVSTMVDRWIADELTISREASLLHERRVVDQELLEGGRPSGDFLAHRVLLRSLKANRWFVWRVASRLVEYPDYTAIRTGLVNLVSNLLLVNPDEGIAELARRQAVDERWRPVVRDVAVVSRIGRHPNGRVLTKAAWRRLQATAE